MRGTAWMRGGLPAVALGVALAACLAGVTLWVRDDGSERLTALLQLRRPALAAAAKQQTLIWEAQKERRIRHAKSPIQDGDLPPFGEPLAPPAPACDKQALMDCLGSMQAMKEHKPEYRHMTNENSRAQDLFCRDMHVPFECACSACNVTALKYWSNTYWTNDADTKSIFNALKAEAECPRLEEDGAMTLPAGHGCHMLFQRACQAPLDEFYCPRVLRKTESLLGVAGTLENDDVKFIDAHKTCRTRQGWEKERQCKIDHKKAFDPSSDYCAPNHEYIKCACDACEHDLEAQVANNVRYQRCGKMSRLLQSGGHDATGQGGCDKWYTDECVTPLDANYCEGVHGSEAWRRANGLLQSPVAGSWADDGMGWESFCKGVVMPMEGDEMALEAQLGDGWREWCARRFNVTSGKRDYEDEAPLGSGENGHDRLAVSGMPAPRTFDNPDPNMGFFRQEGGGGGD